MRYFEAPKDRYYAARSGAPSIRGNAGRCSMSRPLGWRTQQPLLYTHTLCRAGQPAVYLLARGAVQEVNWYKQLGSWFAGDSVIEGDARLQSYSFSTAVHRDGAGLTVRLAFLPELTPLLE